MPKKIWLTAAFVSSSTRASITRFYQEGSAKYIPKYSPDENDVVRVEKPLLIIVESTKEMATDLANAKRMEKLSQSAARAFGTNHILHERSYFPVLFIAFEDFSKYVLN